MKNTPLILSSCFLLCFVDRLPVISACQYQKCSQASGRQITTETKELSELDNDFESGTLQPWIDESQGSMRWKVENQYSSWEPNNPAPQPSNGENVLRIDRGDSPSFGVAILRSPTFKLAFSENYISFSFWIRSKWPAFTNLELYLAENGNEELHLSLSNYSDISNRAWKSHSVLFRGESSSNFSLVFYAYCGIDAEDAVCIDDIRVGSFQDPTTPSVSESTTTSSVTAIFSESTTVSSVNSTFRESTTLSSMTATFTESAIMSSVTATLTTTDVMDCSAEQRTTVYSTFYCPDNRDMLYPGSDEPCTAQYYECTNCTATLKDCEGKMIFNSDLQKCQPCPLVTECVDACINLIPGGYN